MSALGTVDDALARVIDDVVERRLRPLVAELAELRAALQARGSTNAPTEYLTSTEAARLLKLSPQTLNRWVKAGRLEAEGPPRARRFKRSIIERFMSAKDIGTGETPDLDALAQAALHRRYRR